MFDDIRQNISRLIALYESERERSQGLMLKTAELEEKLATGQKQIDELENQIKVLKLKTAFEGGSGKNTAAKETVDKLIQEIDRCISLLEG